MNSYANIMIVEDEPIVAKSIKYLLMNIGYSVTAVVESGEDAIKKVEEIEPDLILMDINLKGRIDGIETTCLIHKHFNIPVVYLTAYADEDTLRKAKETLPYGYIIKPFTEVDLHATLEMALHHHHIDSLIRESREWFLTTLNSIEDAVITTNKHGRITFINPVAEKLTGWKKEETIDRSLYDVFRTFDELNEEIIPDTSGETILEDYSIHPDRNVTLVSRDNKKYLISGRCSSIRDDRGQVKGYVLTFWDITVQKKNEEQLEKYRLDLEEQIKIQTKDLISTNARLYEEIEERKQIAAALAAEKECLSVTLRSIADGVIASDTEGRITLFNRIAEEITGWRQEEAFNKPLWEVFKLIDTGREESTGIKSGTSSENMILITRDNSRCNIAYNTADICDETGNAIGEVITFCDVTDKLKTEEAFIRSEKLKSVGILAGGIAHDFNNILTAIVGNIDLSLMDVNPDKRCYRWLDDAKNAALRARNLTQQLLPFSCGGEPIKKTIKLSEHIRNSCISTLQNSNFSYDLWIDDDLWPVDGDEGQLDQVFNNLIINAKQAMPMSGTISVIAENITTKSGRKSSLRSGKYVKISFKDEGVGISRENLTKIFDPYFTTKHNQSGLGLTSCISIIKKHGGLIDVESELDAGSLFTLYLPASEKQVEKIEVDEKMSSGQGKVLLMDDNVELITVTTLLLERMGYEVTCCYDGKDAIEIYKEELDSGKPFDVVVMDLSIPKGMGGKEAIVKLHEVDPDANAIVSSGYSNDPVMSDFCSYGFAGVLPKPYNYEALNIEIQNVINSSRFRN